jgi:Zn-dependent protease
MPALLLLLINLGLIWLLMAAPIGSRTIRFRRTFKANPGRLWEAVYPLGRNAHWSSSVVSVDLDEGNGRVVQHLSQADRRGEPIARTIAVEAMEGPWQMAYEARVVDDSSLDRTFWADFRERRMIRSIPGGAELIVEQTDRYRGFAFLIFRFFMMRRELLELEGWLRTGIARRNGLFEHPATQAVMAVVSTLILWPFFGLDGHGLLLSSLLTLVIALHELGHLVAYRAFGHEKVRMIFIPFLGGVAIGGRPYNSHFEVAACALMGAGLSAFFVPVVIAATGFLESGAATEGLAPTALMFLLVLGAFNLLNLLPMSRFDGGQVLRQVFPTRDGQMGATFAVTAAILWVGWRIGIPAQALYGGLAVMALLSFTNQISVKPRQALDPMTGGERLFAGFGYYAALAIHAYGLVYAADRLFAG